MTSRLLSDAHRYILRCLSTHQVHSCSIFTSISEVIPSFWALLLSITRRYQTDFCSLLMFSSSAQMQLTEFCAMLFMCFRFFCLYSLQTLLLLNLIEHRYCCRQLIQFILIHLLELMHFMSMNPCFSKIMRSLLKNLIRSLDGQLIVIRRKV